MDFAENGKCIIFGFNQNSSYLIGDLQRKIKEARI